MPTLTGTAQPENTLPIATAGISYLRGVTGAGASVRSGVPFVNIMDHGAAGNGTTDDTAALTAAIAAAGAGGGVLFPMGRTFIVDVTTISTAITLFAAWGVTIKRKTTAAAGNWITVTASSFFVNGITFDGNKAANSNACHNVLISTGCTESEFNGCTFKNAKTNSGYGSGLLFSNGHGTSNRHRIINCMSFSNDEHGVSAADGYGIVIEGGEFYSNGGGGIYFNNYDLTLTQKINYSRIKNARVHDNTSSGVTIGNFVQDNVISGSARLYGFTAPECTQITVEGCTIYDNSGYGIAAYGDYIFVKDNVVFGNGNGGSTFGGINFIAQYGTCTGNVVTGNDAYGLDCGNCIQSLIEGNHVLFNCTNGGSGVTLEACSNVKFIGNTVENNGTTNTVQVSVYRHGGDGSGNWFPNEVSVVLIKDNYINLGSGQIGIKVYDGADNVFIEHNHFHGTDLTKFIQNFGDVGRMVGNIFPPGVSDTIALDGSSAITFPDGMEQIFFNSATAVEGVRTQSMATVADGIAWVDVTAAGSGYTSAPTVTFTGGGGAGAAGTAVVYNGTILGVRMTAYGSGYTSAPTVGFSGGGGAGATATAQWKHKLQQKMTLDIHCNQAVTIKRNGTVGPVIENPDTRDVQAWIHGIVRLLAYANQWRLIGQTAQTFIETIVDGVTAPSATSGFAKIYVDTADGDLKVIFGDGTVKTIVVDT